MAIYHLSVKIHSRSTGASVVAAAAYRAGEKLRDERARHTHDYRRKRGVIHREILLPEGAPAAWRDRAALWNAVAMGERRHDAQMAREIEIALPRELSLEANIQMARDFARAECVRLGMVADLAVHLARGSDGRPQLHAHILLTLRRIGPEGSFGQKKQGNGTIPHCSPAGGSGGHRWPMRSLPSVATISASITAASPRRAWH